MKISNWGLGLASAMVGIYMAGSTANAAEINFEGVDAGTILSQVSAGKGVSGQMTGTIGVYAYNPAMGTDVNAAVVYDSSCPPGGVNTDCSGGDTDLGSPNHVHGGPGVGKAGETTNTTALGKILIIGEDLFDADRDGLVDAPDDVSLKGAYYNFDFSSAPKGTVTINSITMLDIENTQKSSNPHIIMSGPSIPVTLIPVPGTGDNGVLTTSNIDVEGVASMRIDMSGSGGLASITYTE